MNAKNIKFVVVLVLAVLIAAQVLVSAKAQALPTVSTFFQATPDPCKGINPDMIKHLNDLDSPSRRAHYALMDRIGACVKIAGSGALVSSYAIPVTGLENGYNSSGLKTFKERQAERMSDPTR